MEFPPEITVLFTAALPVSELRGAIPLGIIYFKFPLWKTFLISIAGNLLPVIPLILLLGPFDRRAGRIPFLSKIFGYFKRRAYRRRELIEKYQLLGLYLFVAVPLPVTGAWTGCLLAYLFTLPPVTSFISIFLGVLTAGIIVSVLVITGIKAGLLVGLIIAGGVLFILNKVLPG